MKKLLILLFLTLIPVSVTANASDYKAEMEHKLKINAEEYTFDETIYDSNADLYWSGPEKSIYVRYENNTLSDIYISYTGGNQNSGKVLPKVSKTDASNIAYSFVSQVDGGILPQLDTAKIAAAFDFSQGYTFTFSRKINGISYNENFVSVDVDPQSGNVISYRRNFNDSLNFTLSGSILSPEIAFEMFKQSKGLQLRYNKTYTDNQAKVYLAYVPMADRAINAVTGEVITYPTAISEDSHFDSMLMHEKNTQSIYSFDGLITSAEAISIVDNHPILKTDGAVVNNARYFKNSFGSPLVSLIYSGVSSHTSVTLNAETGEIVEFSKYNFSPAQDTQNTETPLELADRYVELYLEKYIKNVTPRQIQQGDKTVLLYERHINGIPYKNNGIYFVLDGSGDIIRFSLEWDNTDFPEISNNISADGAYDIFYAMAGLELTYRDNGSGEMIPVYVPSTQSSGIVSETTGDILNYDGSVLKPKKRLAYLDLDSHYSKKQAQALSDCNIFVSRGDVLLDGFITQKDYILLISELMSNNKPVIDNTGTITDVMLDTLYNYMVTNGIMDRGEVSPDSNVPRIQAVKWLIRALGYKDVAELSSIFQRPFLDQDRVADSLQGYLTLSRSLGLVAGSNGCFYPDAYLTNGDSLILIYNYLSRGQVQ